VSRNKNVVVFNDKGRVDTEIAGIDSTFNNYEVDLLNKLDQRLQNRTNETRSIKTAISTTRQVKSKLVAQNNRKNPTYQRLLCFRHPMA
jgi:hypothetical protein